MTKLADIQEADQSNYGGLLNEYLSEDGKKLKPLDWKDSTQELREAWFNKYNQLYGNRSYKVIGAPDLKYKLRRFFGGYDGSLNIDRNYANLTNTKEQKTGITQILFQQMQRICL